MPLRKSDPEKIYTEKDHTLGKDVEAKEVYYTLLDEMEDQCAFSIYPTKHNIQWVVNRQKFITLYIRQNHVLMEIELEAPVASSRIVRVQRNARLNYVHVIKVAHTQHVNRELVTWVKEAYDLKLREERKKPNSYYHG